MEFGAWLETEVFDERVAGRLVRPHRFGLPTAPIQREHQLGVESLTVRMFPNGVYQRCDRVGVLAEVEATIGEPFDGGKDQLFDPGRRGAGEPEVGEFAERFQMMEVECRRKIFRSGRPIAVARRGPTIANEYFEAHSIDVAGLDVEQVARSLPLHNVAAEQPAQLGYPRLQCVVRVSRLVIAPQLVDQAVVRHSIRHCKREKGKKCLQSGASDNNVTAICPACPHATQEAHLHTSPPIGVASPPSPRSQTPQPSVLRSLADLDWSKEAGQSRPPSWGLGCGLAWGWWWQRSPETSDTRGWLRSPSSLARRSSPWGHARCTEPHARSDR